MPLVDITNTQDADQANRKRTLDSYLKPRDGESLCYPAPAPAPIDQLSEPLSDREEENGISSTPADRATCSPAKSDPGLTASGSSPLDANSPSPNVTPRGKQAYDATDLSISAALTAKQISNPATPEPPVKKRKVTPQDKAAKALLNEAKKHEKEATKAKAEEEKRQKAADREKRRQEKELADARAEEERRQKAAEREKKRQEKELADKLKAEQKAQKEAEKAKKEAEKAKKDAEKEKKLASQKKISDMFVKGAATPKKQQAALKPEQFEEAPTKSSTEPASSYDLRFKPFFLKEGVTLASNPSKMDDETREAKTKILESYINGERTLGSAPLREHMLDALQTPFRYRYGRVYPSVRKIMAEYHDHSAREPIDLTTESQNAQISHIREALKVVPVKSLKFGEDVRPPYVGTVSGLPPGIKSLRQVAIRPTAKVIPVLNYDYDSETEWQEEDGEDVEDLDDEDDDVDNDEDMEDFLDDSEDVGPARLVFWGGMEPESTGLCWENRQRHGSTTKMLDLRMEFILESPSQHGGIDPFSDLYWKPTAGDETPAVSETAPSSGSSSGSSSAPSKLSANARANQMAPPPAPSDAFQLLARKPGPKKAPQPLPKEMHDKFRELLRSRPNTSKIGLTEWFAGEHPDCSRSQIKVSWDLLTEKADRAGRGTSWKLRDNA